MPSRRLSLLLTLLFGALTLVGILLWPPLGELLLGWGALLAALALLFGILNLLLIHFQRLVNGGNLYSLVLLFGLLLALVLGASDATGVTDDGLSVLFNRILSPLEAALASLIPLFLLFAAYRLLQRRRSGWSALFLVSTVFVLAARAPLPGTLVDVVGEGLAEADALVSGLVVVAGMRGLLLGIALGVVIVSLRLLTGGERPYDT